MKDKAILGGSIAAALAASLCCLGPLVAVVLGLGSFSLASTFETLRPYLLGLTAALLVAGFYLTYRGRVVSCADGSCQTLRASRASKVMLWLITVAAIAFAAFPYYSGALLKANNQSAANQAERLVANSGEQTAIISVSGMTCRSCATTVRLALNKVNGLRSADVSYENKEAKVSYDAAAVTPEQLKAAIESAGYRVTKIEGSPKK
jgi:mercuric ion transport protein